MNPVQTTASSEPAEEPRTSALAIVGMALTCLTAGGGRGQLTLLTFADRSTDDDPRASVEDLLARIDALNALSAPPE